jgi:hypothetical protein
VIHRSISSLKIGYLRCTVAIAPRMEGPGNWTLVLAPPGISRKRQRNCHRLERICGFGKHVV